MLREASKEIPRGNSFFPFVISWVSFFLETRKHGGGYVFNYFAYIVTLLRLWFFFFVVVSLSLLNCLHSLSFILLPSLPPHIPQFFRVSWAYLR